MRRRAAQLGLSSRHGHISCIIVLVVLIGAADSAALQPPTRGNLTQGAGRWALADLPDWAGRDGFGSGVLGGELLIFGGRTKYGLVNDVWRSSGFGGHVSSWEQGLLHAPWAKRQGFASVVHQVAAGSGVDDDSSGPHAASSQKLVLMGGRTRVDGEDVYFDDVWVTDNGERWHELFSNSPRWAARDTCAAVMGGDIFVMGGYGVDGEYNDVWKSEDGRDWEEVTPSAPWRARTNHGVATFRDELWVVGGVNYEMSVAFNDVRAVFASDRRLHWLTRRWLPAQQVWHSADGKSWAQAGESVPWLPRSHMGLAVYPPNSPDAPSPDERMVVVAGQNMESNALCPTPNCTCFADVWETIDGVHWSPQAVSVLPTWWQRSSAQTNVFNGALVMLGGQKKCTSDEVSDVWIFSKDYHRESRRPQPSTCCPSLTCNAAQQRWRPSPIRTTSWYLVASVLSSFLQLL